MSLISQTAFEKKADMDASLRWHDDDDYPGSFARSSLPGRLPVGAPLRIIV